MPSKPLEIPLFPAEPVPYVKGADLRAMSLADLSKLRFRALSALNAAGLLETAWVLEDVTAAIEFRTVTEPVKK